MTVYVEPPYGWAGRRLLTVALEKLGYRVEAEGIGEDWRLLLT